MESSRQRLTILYEIGWNNDNRRTNTNPVLHFRKEEHRMSNNCFYCEKESESIHSITVYGKDGSEEEFEVLCSDCYEEWLMSLKG